jgi:hypothetical protein
MGIHRTLVLAGVLALGSLLGLVGCGPRGECGCTPVPTGTVTGRITDAQGLAVAGAEVCAVQIIGSTPPVGLTVVAKGGTGADGSFLLRVDLGRSRLLVRTQVGSVVYLPCLGPEFELKAASDTIPAMDLVLTPTNGSDVTVTITPVHGAQQEDDLSLDQLLTLEGLDCQFHVASVKPVPVGGQETAAFPQQPPGAYTLSLSRGETTGTHAQSGTAKAILTLVEGLPSSVTLTVN